MSGASHARVCARLCPCVRPTNACVCVYARVRHAGPLHAVLLPALEARLAPLLARALEPQVAAALAEGLGFEPASQRLFAGLEQRLNEHTALAARHSELLEALAAGAMEVRIRIIQ